MPLTDVLATGVPVNGRISSELLQTIFFDKTPLHDGAAIIRNDKVLAAGCVLPLTERELRGAYRLGTRHRAAIGMSEASDALCVVVSEETGNISIAKDGRLERNLDRTTLHQRLSDYYAETAKDQPFNKWRPWTNWKFKMPGPRRILVNLAYLLLSFVLALVATVAVRQQNNPLISTTMTGVKLQQVGELPADTTLTTPLPSSVSVNFQTPASELASLGPNSFQAVISFADVQEGVNRVAVDVSTSAENVLVSGANPAEVDVTVAPIISKTLPIVAIVTGMDELSSAYEVQGETLIKPANTEITGPLPQVERVESVVTEVSVAGATTTVNETSPLVALDADGQLVDDVTVDPLFVVVTVYVARRVDARDVGVNAVTEGSPPEEYWLSGLVADPPSITVQGDPNVIAEMGSFVDTLPVDLNGAVGDLVVNTPLDLPEGIQALDEDGNILGTVTVHAQISPRTGDLLTGRPVELINDRGTFTVTLVPPAVQLLLSGPIATLQEIEAKPELVRVVIDALDLLPGQSVEMTPDIILPEGIRAQMIENSVLVTTGP